MIKINTIERLIKNRRSIRFFKKIPIKKDLIKHILSMAIWAPCPHGFQPWRFLVLKKKSKVKYRLIKLLEKNLCKTAIGFRTILMDNIRIMKSADTVVVILNNNELTRKGRRLGSKYEEMFEIFEAQSIAASIQNILLIAHSHNIGSVWLGLPLLFDKGILKILHEPNTKLMAFIAMGYKNARHIVKTTRIQIRDKLRCL